MFVRPHSKPAVDTAQITTGGHHNIPKNREARMDNTFHQQRSDTRRRSSFAAGLRVLDRFESWLAHIMELTWLTEEEQKSAGIHFSQLTEEEQVGAGICPDNRPNG